jgi:hypothetical protein
MSSPITPVPGPRGQSEPMSPALAQPGGPKDFALELDAVERALAVDAHTAAPPPELLAQMAVADQLAAEGLHVVFSQARAGRPAQITVSAAGDAPARTLSTAQASELAAGKPLG